MVLDPWWNPATESQAVNREAKEGLAASLLDGEDLASAVLTVDDVPLLVG